MEKLKKLFQEEGRCEKLEVVKKQCVEEIIKIILRIVLIASLFFLFNFLGESLVKHKKLIEGGFNSDLLFSLFVLPLLYSLKDIKDCFESCFVKIWISDNYITVKRGFLNKKYDKLYIDDVNNIEMTQTLGGKYLKYLTIDLYALGGFLRMPYLADTEKNFKAISELMKISEKGSKSSK